MSLIADFQSLMRPIDEDDDGLPQLEEQAGVLPDRGEGMVSAWRLAQADLIQTLIARIHAQPAEFFECLVIDLLLSMGYGGRRRDLAQRLGCTGDGGIDGLIAQDELGLDLIYLQAKRLKPGTTVPVSDVRDFAGSLDARHAVKGIFFATNHFSAAAVEFCSHVSRRIVLVDGERLAELMIRHNIGVVVQETFQIKRLDRDYFAPSGVRRIQEIISASIHPRR